MSDVLVIASTALGKASWLVEAARRRGLRVGDPTDGRRRYYYGGPDFADRMAADLGVGLLEPPDHWLPFLPRERTGRTIHHTKLGRTRRSGALLRQAAEQQGLPRPRLRRRR